MVLILRKFIKLNILLLIIMFLGSCIHGGKDMVRFADCPDSPNCVSSLGDPGDEQHYILPFQLKVSGENAFIQIKKYLESRGDVKILETEEGVYIHAVFISKFMRFKDDVEFLIQQDDSNGAVIDIRSASRLGYSDLGVNRKRMEEIREYLTL